MIESVPIDAVPLIVITQDVRPGALALPVADQSIALAVVSFPCAVPVNFKSPGQVAVNDPFAATGVCSVTFHLKSVQVLGVGTIVADVQLPTSELFPAIDGSVIELFRSKPVHPAATAATAHITRRNRFFILLYPVRRDPQPVRAAIAGLHGGPLLVIGRTDPAEQRGKSHNYTIPSGRNPARSPHRNAHCVSVLVLQREIRNQRMGWTGPAR